MKRIKTRSVKFVILFSLLLLAASSVFANPISSLICNNPGSTTAGPNDTGIHANSCTDFSYAFPASQPATGQNNWLYGYLMGSTATPPSLVPTTFTALSATPAYDMNGNLIPGQNAGWYSANFYRYWTALDAFGSHSNADYTDYHTPPYCTTGLSCNPTNPGLGGYDPRSPTGPDSGDLWADRRYVVPTGYTGPVQITLQAQKDPRTATGNAQGFTEYVLDYSGGVTTQLAVLAVPVNQNPNAPNLPSTVPGAIGQPIYSISPVSVNVKPGDILDFVTVPNYNSTVGGYADFSSGSFQLITITGVPEPSTIILVGAGLLLVGFTRKRFAL